MPNSHIKAMLQAATEQSCGSLAGPEAKPQVHWHIEGDTVIFHLSPEACYHLGVPTAPLQ